MTVQKTAMVTGASGFIGTHLVADLLQKGWNVIAVSRHPCRYSLRVPQVWLCKSFLDLQPENFDGVNVLFHQAAINDTLENDDALVFDVNVHGSQRLFKTALAHGCNRIVYASSMAVYGDAESPLREDGPLQPLNAYGRSKKAMEDMTKQLAARNYPTLNAPPIIVGLRYGNVYGPLEGHKGRMASMVTQIADQMRADDPLIFRDGTQQRDFVHVMDVVRANLLAAVAHRSTIVNVGTGHGLCFNDLIAALNNVLGTHRRPRYVENPNPSQYQSNVVLDPSFAQKEIGFKAEIRITEGLDRYFEGNDSRRYFVATDEPNSLLMANMMSPTMTPKQANGLIAESQTSDTPISLGCSQIHDFNNKLRQTSTIIRLREYIQWQRALRRSEVGLGFEYLPHIPLVSVNLDMTTACNHTCAFCVDADIINLGKNFRRADVLSTIQSLSECGLKSVILIGGGEPTLHHAFGETVRLIKRLGLQLGVATNGSQLRKIIAVADVLEPGDWVRLSLDAGYESTYQAIHNPHGRGNTLYDVTQAVRLLHNAAPDIEIGYSYVITWDGLMINGSEIPENISEIPKAAELARDNGFTYLALKPCLEKSIDNPVERVALSISKPRIDKNIQHIKDAINEAQERVKGTIAIHCSVNLQAMLRSRIEVLRIQPKVCHIGFFRQVITPLGTYHCPAFRGDIATQIGPPTAYASQEKIEIARQNTAARLLGYDASFGCKDVACFYNSVNWAIEEMIESDENIEALDEVADKDFFL